MASSPSAKQTRQIWPSFHRCWAPMNPTSFSRCCRCSVPLENGNQVVNISLSTCVIFKLLIKTLPSTVSGVWKLIVINTV